MKAIALIWFLMIASNISFCQSTATSSEVLAEVLKAQGALKTAEYSVERRDTLLTGDIRTMTGTVVIAVDKTDTLLGFRFWAKKHGEKEEKAYDGRVCYAISPDTKTYRLMNSPAALHSMFLGGGGHLVIPDLVKIDTAQCNGISVMESQDHYDIIVSYPNLTDYDVTKRKKIITIDRKSMLPVAVRQHQESYGKVQDLYFKITELKVNPPRPYNFTSLPFLKAYTYVSPEPVKTHRQPLQGKNAPQFSLESFDGKLISANDWKGKVVLLDFWEIWCGPCIESMPEVIALYNKYYDKGLAVYGITNDLKQLPSARAFAEKKKINFPLLIGNEQVKKEYQLEAVPLYVLIDKKGIIRLIRPGYSAELEEMVLDILK